MLGACRSVARLALNHQVVIHKVGQVTLLGQHGQEGGDKCIIVVRASTVVNLNRDSKPGQSPMP